MPAQLAQVTALVLALLAHFSPGLARSADRAAVTGIARAAVDLSVTPDELSTLVVYAALESGVKDHPRAWSWDARRAVSCGMLQEPCSFVKEADDAAQARYWIISERQAGLASVDSDPKRAARRQKLAEKVLEEVASCPWHAGLLEPIKRGLAAKP
jgi:hypothetical protein